MNTQLFHVKASYRARKNCIERLVDTVGRWVTNKREVSEVARKYFVNLFSTNGVENIDQILEQVPTCITEEMNDVFIEPVSDKEIVDALRQMDPRKAPRSDGLSILFFKENWDVVGAEVTSCCKEILHGLRSAREVNDTILVLIPKVDEPKEMAHY